jgi:hypothetical protein
MLGLLALQDLKEFLGSGEQLLALLLMTSCGRRQRA